MGLAEATHAMEKSSELTASLCYMKKRFDWEIQLLGSTIVVQVIEVQSEVAHSDMGNKRVVYPSLPHLLYTQSAANKLQEI
ncbi:unnamed protein product [Clavelina lepadiformis]|uniref:Uncharacterized protein n=1 Tax=Clavelina lepadiformis TaxID=159417 RepID=A0ABP0G986_CLALP